MRPVDREVTAYTLSARTLLYITWQWQATRRSDAAERVVDPVVVGLPVDVPAAALLVLVDGRERLPAYREPVGGRPVRLAGVDLFQRRSELEVPRLAGLVPGPTGADTGMSG